jgi:hypothetical protein
MKKLKFLSMAAMAATLVTSCSNGRNDEVITGSEPVAVEFAAGNTASVLTRVTGSDWAQGDSIGVFMIKETPGTLAAAYILEGADNIRYNSAGGSGEVGFTVNTASRTIFYPVLGNVKFVAYYPYKTLLTDYELPFSVASQDNQSAIDLLYAAAGTSYTKASGTVKLPFEHKLVKLEFNITNGAGVTAPLAGLTVTVDGQLPDGVLDLTDGSVTAGGAAQTITALTNTAGTFSEAILLPAASNSGKKFYFDNGEDAPFTAAIPDTDWKAGNKYIYTVMLQKSAVTITGEIEPWTTYGGGNVDAN